MLNIFVISDMYNGYSTSFLNLITIIAIFSGIFIIITKNPIISVLYLILLFSSISCYLIFILMLINIRVSELISDTNNNIPLALLALIAIFIPFSNLIPDTKFNLNESSFEFNGLIETITNTGQISYVTSNN